MTIKKLLLGSTALIGAGLLTVGAPQGVSAAEIKPLGALDIQVGGFMRWYALSGAIAGKRQVRDSSSRDFRNDTEVFVYARGTDEATGLRYGAFIELEADTNTTGNADETFVFIEGNFGQFRFGDKDGGSDTQKIGAFTLAAFSGGIDGVGPIDMGATVSGANSGDDTKIIYITPTIAGFNAVVSYTPHVSSQGQDLSGTSSNQPKDLFEGGIAYRGNFGGVGIITSVIGHYGWFEAGPARGNPGTDSGQSGAGETWKVYGGAVVDISGFRLGGGVGTGQGIGANQAGAAVFQRGSDVSWFNLGGAAKLGPANVSLTYGQVFDGKDGPTGRSREPWEVVLGADFGVAPGLVVGGELVYFNVSGDSVSAGGAGRTDTGWVGLVGVRAGF
jgi:outer membrane protein OmpU